MSLRQITVDRVNDPVDIYANDDSRIYASLLGAEGIHQIFYVMGMMKPLH